MSSVVQRLGKAIGTFKKMRCVKVSKYGVFSGPYFPVFGLNMDIYGVNLRIEPAEKTPHLDTFHAMMFSRDFNATSVL